MFTRSQHGWQYNPDPDSLRADLCSQAGDDHDAFSARGSANHRPAGDCNDHQTVFRQMIESRIGRHVLSMTSLGQPVIALITIGRQLFAMGIAFGVGLYRTHICIASEGSPFFSKKVDQFDGGARLRSGPSTGLTSELIL